jgi:hypothetical protein
MTFPVSDLDALDRNEALPDAAHTITPLVVSDCEAVATGTA